MYLVKTPSLVQNLFPGFTWCRPGADKNVYLTFDDGPIPKVTPWVLRQLRKYEAQATFFCIGDNVRKHPNIYAEVRAAGHRVGNHTMHHINGWRTKQADYTADTEKCARLVDSDLFRPPYGRLTPRQAKQLREKYEIVLWDVLSGDFDEKIDGERCLDNVLRHSQVGSIVVFHDSLKAFPRLRYALPRVLAHFSEAGYRFAAL